MRAITIRLTLAVTLLAAAASAQQTNPTPAAPPPAQESKTFTSAADVQALIAKAKSDRKPDQAMMGERILQLAPYNANLEYRTAVAPAAIHEKEAELFYVIDGSATMVTGGKLVGEARTNAENLSGTGIEGGMSRDVAKGDFIIVPENTPHWFSALNGTLILMTFHVPRPVPGKP
jgi:mannose-6-phosphate isomerase-like protein (cupin superfamily)